MKTNTTVRISLSLGLLGIALAGCTVLPPNGPSVVALPSRDKPLQQFQQEDYACRDYAFRSSDANAAAQGATTNSIGSAALGTLGGAAAGALIGAAAGNPAAGAAIGAGGGLLVGSAAGANGAQYSSANLQARYDTAYAQCMVSKGNSIAPQAPTVYATPPVYAAPPVVYARPRVVYAAPYY